MFCMLLAFVMIWFSHPLGHSENGHASQASREAVVESLPEAKHRVRTCALKRSTKIMKKYIG
jgi:hypothetical protein